MADEKKRRVPVRPRLVDDDDDDLVGPRSRPGPRGASARPGAGGEDEDAPSRRPSRRPRPAPYELDDDEFEDDLVGPRSRPVSRQRGPSPRGPRGVRGSRRGGGERDWLRGLVREIPSFLKLLWGLARDPRVSRADKAIVVAVATYVVIPVDLIPDWIPGLGEVEDVLLLALALSRLLGHAGEEVLLDHWDGDEETLEAVIDALDSATQFLPSPIRGLIGGRR